MALFPKKTVYIFQSPKASTPTLSKSQSFSSSSTVRQGPNSSPPGRQGPHSSPPGRQIAAAKVSSPPGRQVAGTTTTTTTETSMPLERKNSANSTVISQTDLLKVQTKTLLFWQFCTFEVNYAIFLVQALNCTNCTKFLFKFSQPFRSNLALSFFACMQSTIRYQTTSLTPPALSSLKHMRSILSDLLV